MPGYFGVKKPDFRLVVFLRKDLLFTVGGLSPPGEKTSDIL